MVGASVDITLDGYIRVSQTRGREGDSFISPKVQRDCIQGWADTRGVRIGAWHEDLDQSGGKLHRPGLDAMLARIRTGQTGGLAVAHLDRLSRAGVADALRLVESVHEAGAKIAVVDLGIDPTTPVGEFSMTLFLALGRMQRRQFQERWQEAQARAIGRGIHFRAPFGYTKPGRAEPIVPNPVTAPLVKRAFQLRAAGEAWPRIAAYLNERHPPNRAPAWTRSTVNHLIRNPAYLGRATCGKHVQAGAHPALVSVELWEAANAVKAQAPSRGDGEGTLLAGLVRCAGCRYVMSRGATQGVGRPEQLLIYTCRRHHSAGRCGASCSIKRELVERYVEEEFLKRYAEVSVEGVVDSAALSAARQEVAEAEAELEAFRDNERIRAALEAVGDSSFEQGILGRAERLVAAREKLAAVRASAVGFALPDAVSYRALTLPERRALLRAGIGAVFVRRSLRRGGRGVVDTGARVHICWTGEEPENLPGRHNKTVVAPRPFDW
ncbi:MAG TPA: recombinase family protein [Solirubrobacteraceae bacterium]|nr:recombinase family protein [Solirubrobacteraceae bacterium]